MDTVDFYLYDLNGTKFITSLKINLIYGRNNMKVYLVYQLYTDWDNEPQEDLDSIFKNREDAYNYAEAEFKADDFIGDNDNFRIEEWEVK